ncbi:hypothetical protein [Mycobacterium sp. 29Ha]|uniref:hypothetical protein n=1 Tax=Mycobacterium sp. 29Ha TaxID=2939268 RepID=UPI002938F60D|nr:hypothetical protein [Mycobacterium sp. 29Ha]MDV3132646.1 hypothetical protein [Mycobacterium sp. 29Ha]
MGVIEESTVEVSVVDVLVVDESVVDVLPVDESVVDVLPVGESDEGDDESDISAAATPWPIAIAVPTPKATARPPTRPI